MPEKLKSYILVVDSDVDSRFQMSMVLQRFGYDICTASSAPEAIDFMHVAPPAAIVAEASAGNGLVTLTKKDARFSSVPVIFMAKNSVEELGFRMRKAEFAGCIVKPFDVEKVYQVIEDVVEKTGRKNIRIDTRLKAELEGEQRGKGIIAVLSEYGLFFETNEDAPPVNESRTVKFSIGARTIRVEAVILYDVPREMSPFKRPGIGMKFVKIDPDDQAFIRAFVLEQVQAGTKGKSEGQ